METKLQRHVKGCFYYYSLFYDYWVDTETTGKWQIIDSDGSKKLLIECITLKKKRLFREDKIETGWFSEYNLRVITKTINTCGE